MGTPSLDRVDPVRAWQPWRPDDNQPWSLRWAGHLYRRAAFGGTLPELRLAVKEGPHATIDRLLAGDPAAKTYENLLADAGASIAKGEDESALRGWWLYAMLNSGYPLRERLTLFWHNHFATSIAKVRSTEGMFNQNQLLRRHALGRFRPMLADISRDPAMLVWLDSNRNVKGQANENYAREVMELFTLGTGHYTETDIRAGARAFTGWHTDGDKFTFVARFHDGGKKTFLGQSGNWDGSDIQRIILNQPAAALFLARKLYAAFVAEGPAPPDSLLEPLAERLRQSDYDIGDVVGTILRSQHFFSEYAYRRRVKSPVEFVLGMVRTVRPDATPRELVGSMEAMGQALFAPPNVKGWPGGKSWLNSATVLARQNFAQSMTVAHVSQGMSAGAEVTASAAPVTGTLAIAADAPAPPRSPAVQLMSSDGIVGFVEHEKATQPSAVVNLLTDLFVQGDVSEPTRQRLTTFLADGKPAKAAWQQRVRETAHAVLTLPEYTLS